MGLWNCILLPARDKPILVLAACDLLTRDLARPLTAPISLACPHRSCLPPTASIAPIGLACPFQPYLPRSASPAPMARRTARHWYSALGSGFGSRHWVFLFSLFHIKVHSFPSLWIDRQFIIFSSTPSSSRVNRLWARRWAELDPYY